MKFGCRKLKLMYDILVVRGSPEVDSDDGILDALDEFPFDNLRS
jgi:hypothetical protein